MPITATTQAVPETIEKIKVDIPHPEEQQKIANFLTSLDNKINLNSQALEKLRHFKKGLLQQMFVWEQSNIKKHIFYFMALW